MSIKGRKALQSDNEKLYEHNIAMSEEVQRLSQELQRVNGNLKSVLGDVESLLSTPFIRAVRKLIFMRREYRDALNKKSQSG